MGARQAGDAVEAQTPETYLGVERAQGWVTPPRPGTDAYAGRPTTHAPFALGGTWKIDDEAAEAVRDATIDATVTARKVYLVLSSRGQRRARSRCSSTASRRAASPSAASGPTSSSHSRAPDSTS